MLAVIAVEPREIAERERLRRFRRLWRDRIVKPN
jgi:hypothetical protein